MSDTKRLGGSMGMHGSWRRVIWLAPFLAASRVGAVSAELGPEAAQWRVIVAGMQELSRAPSRQAVPGGPDKRVSDQEVVAPELCGPYGLLCAHGQPEAKLTGQEFSPLNPGFAALGAAGKTGKIDGPGKQGNGRYRMVKNDLFEIEMAIRTGYIDGVFTFKRDPLSGRDSMRYAGRLWDNDKGAWGPALDKTNPVEIRYDAAADRGLIRWQEGGKWKQEGYWNGKAGTRMTIEMGGGWDHDFEQD